MKRELQVITWLLLLTMGLTCSAYGQTWMALGQEIYDHSHSLSTADPCFYTEFGNNVAELSNELWAVSGLRGAVGLGSVAWLSNALQVGDSNWQFGSAFYHFTTNDLFAGGTVNVSAYYAGSSEYINIATSVVRPVQTDTGVKQWRYHSWDPYATTYFDQYWAQEDYTVAIPEDCKEFWVRISKPSSANSYKVNIYNMDVRANVVVDPQGCVTPIASDLNSDCSVDLMDFAALAGQWMDCDNPNDPQCMPTLPWGGANDYH